MQIKYLKGTHDSSVGDVKEVPDLQANVLILHGCAEPFFAKKKAAKTTKLENSDTAKKD